MTTATNRTDFIKFIARLCAGQSALPNQIEAFEKYYDANAPHADNLIAVDEVLISGTANKSMPVVFELYKNDKKVNVCAINLFGGIYRWYTGPDQKVIAAESDIYWQVRRNTYAVSADFFRHYVGQISFIDSKYKRHCLTMTKAQGSIVDP